MSETNQQLIKRLSHDLGSIDSSRVEKLINELGLYEAARVLGYDISHYNNLFLSGRMAIENLKRNSPKTLLEYCEEMKEQLGTVTYNFMKQHHVALQEAIDRNSFRDYDHDWFSANTIITSYASAKQYDDPAIETPQYMWMRVAIQHYHDVPNAVEKVIEMYEELSIGWYTPATPNILNAGKEKPQMSSCFLLNIGDDLKQILKHGVYRAGMISQNSGGMGFDISTVRHSEIGKTGWSNGIIPMLQLYNSLVRYVNQRSRRNGAITMFLRPHHIDALDFIELPKKVGDRYSRAHDLFICLWTSWIFWERIKNDGDWTFFCPAKTPQLNNVYGEEFTKRYIEAENDPTIGSKYKMVMRARDFYEKILNVQRECGMPFLMNGDAANIKSNHRHMGYIRSSNLCVEIIEYTDNETIAVCNLYSLSLRMYGMSRANIPEGSSGEYYLRNAVDFKQLAVMTRKLVDNLNKVIDNNWYPLDKFNPDGSIKKEGIIRKSNMKTRPIGIGVAGFAELLNILDLPFESPHVNLLNKMLFACMYWNSIAESIQLAILEGTYETWEGSPTSQGKFQFDLWKEEFKVVGPNPLRVESDDDPIDPSVWNQDSFNLKNENGDIIDTILPTWEDLRRCMVKYKMRNSLLIALMPTASTAQIRRNCESVEAHQSNLYSRKVLKCSYPVLSRYLVTDFEEEGIWNSNTVEYMRVKDGSIKGFTQYVINNPNLFPEYKGNESRLRFLEQKYKTMWEIPQKVFMKLAAERGRYIDQSASTNVYIRDCADDKLRACHLTANMLGLKTLQYYLRQTGGDTIKFTADPSLIKHIQGIAVETAEYKPKTPSLEDNKIVSEPKYVCTDDICVACT